MPNIKFNYLYRDAGNYKKFNSVIFPKPGNISLAALNSLIESNLIDKTWFYAKEWNLPELFPDTIDLNNDPTWHEFENVECTDERSTTNLFHLIAAIGSIKYP